MNVFLQKQEDGSYRTFDLFGSLDQTVEVDPKKALASLICGDIKDGDLLIAGSTNLERLRNELRIKERLTTLPPVSAALEIKQDLESRGIPDDFIAAVVACCKLEMPATKIVEEEEEGSTASINKLREAEEDASQNLSPTINPAKKAIKKNPKDKKSILAIFSGILKNTFGRLKKFRSKDVATLSSLRGMNAGHGTIFTKKKKNYFTIDRCCNCSWNRDFIYLAKESKNCRRGRSLGSYFC